MQWQDIVLGVGQIIFFLALIPSIRSKDKPALSSSIITATVLLAYALVFATLSLWFTVLTDIITTIFWYILAYQKFTQK